MALLEDKVLQFLRQPINTEGALLLDIHTHVQENKAVVNKLLYGLEMRKMVIHVSQTPAMWKAAPAQVLPGAETKAAVGVTSAVAAHTAAAVVSVLTTPASPTKIPLRAAMMEAIQSATIKGIPSSSCVLQESARAHVGSNSVTSIIDRTALLKLGEQQASPGGRGDCGDVSESDAETAERVLKLLSSCSGSTLHKTHVMSNLKITSQVANRVLYSLQKDGKVKKLGNAEWVLVSTGSGPFVASSSMTKGDNYKKSYSNTLSAKCLEELTRAIKMVGILMSRSSRNTQGTGFRVGTSYFMTAAHVVKEILECSESDSKDPKERLKEPYVYAMFDYHGPGEGSSKKYYFEGWYWMNDDVDIALLKFDEKSCADESFPPPYSEDIFFPDDPSICFHRKESLRIIGHQHNDGKEIDQAGRMHKPDFCTLNIDFPHLFEEAESKQNDFIFYQRVKLEDGSSGAPVFACHGDKLVLIAVHLKGYPSSAVALPCSSKKKLPRFQAGAKISAVRQKIQSHGREFSNDVFQTQSNGPNSDNQS